MNYLEEVAGREAYLIYESRWSGPPADRTDPFTANEIDIGEIVTSFLDVFNIKLSSAVKTTQN